MPDMFTFVTAGKVPMLPLPATTTGLGFEGTGALHKLHRPFHLRPPLPPPSPWKRNVAAERQLWSFLAVSLSQRLRLGPFQTSALQRMHAHLLQGMPGGEEDQREAMVYRDTRLQTKHELEQGLEPVLPQLLLSRRGFQNALLASACPLFLNPACAEEPPFNLFEDTKDGFSLLVPSSWEQKEKAGATVLFEDPDLRSTTVGVVVNPVRITSLKDFGSLEFVADKLLQAERRKESTLDVAVLGLTAQEREPGPVLYYQIDYTLESTRGNKRVLTNVAVAQNKLFILNINLPEKALSASGTLLQDMRTVLNSFSVLL